MSRVVVVGAGVGGLAAACRLAALGHQVTVCEAWHTVGGKLGWRTLQTPAGTFGFDTGPSLLTMPAVLQELFATVGADLDLQRTTLPAVRFADGTQLPGTWDREEFTTAVGDVFGGAAAAGWTAFSERGRKVWKATHASFLESPLDGPGDLLRLVPSQVRDIRTVAPWASLRSLGERYLPDARLRMLLDRYATYTGSDPRKAPAALAVVPWVEQQQGAWYVPGGLHRIATTLAGRLLELGGRIHLDSAVSRITTAGDRVTGVVAGGLAIPADVVVANADAAHVYGHLLDRSPRRGRGSGTPSFSGLAVLLAVEGPGPGAHHSVFFPADYEAEFDDLAAGRPIADPAVYVAAPDDPATAPPGHSAWFVLVNAPRQGPYDWTQDRTEAVADHALATLAERGLEVRDRVRARLVLSPAELEQRTLAPGGSIYGSASNGARAAFLRPPNRTRIRGLFLVGGSTHPGGGLPLVMLSGRIVARQIGRA